MVKRLFLLVLITLTGLCQAQSQPAVSAFVDRTDINLNNVITLSVRIDADLGDAEPSFTGLTQDFEQLGVSKTSSYTNSNGVIESWNEYRVSIKPKRIGTLTIPTLRVGGQLTLPITINVSEAPITTSTENNEIFIETSLSKDNVYVQEQFIFTIKLNFTVGFDQGAQLSTPQVADSVVQQLGSDNSYQELIGGVRYNVTERKYVIFPQSSGELTIAPITFSATMGRRGGLSRILNNRGNVREINLTSEPHVITIKPVPDSFTGQTWFPSKAFNINESWSGDFDNLTVGDSITRNLQVSAQGLSSSLLPDFDFYNSASTNNPDLKFYPDQAIREDQATIEGVTGVRSQGTAIVPSAEGEFILPAIEIPWWNVETDTQQTATIAERRIVVAPDLNALANIQPLGNTTSLSQTSNSIPETLAPSGAFNVYWVIAAVMFAIAWLFSTSMWLKARRMLEQVGSVEYANVAMPISNNASVAQTRQNASVQGASNSIALPHLKTAYNVLEKACGQDNKQFIKQALLSWGQACFNRSDITSLEKLKSSSAKVIDNADHINAQDFHQLLDQLEQSLYSEDNAMVGFDATNLLQSVKKIQFHSQKMHEETSKDNSLPPLYKN